MAAQPIQYPVPPQGTPEEAMMIMELTRRNGWMPVAAAQQAERARGTERERARLAAVAAEKAEDKKVSDDEWNQLLVDDIGNPESVAEIQNRSGQQVLEEVQDEDGGAPAAGQASAGGGLDDRIRHLGCVLPHPCEEGGSEVFPVHLRGGGPGVSGTAHGVDQQLLLPDQGAADGRGGPERGRRPCRSAAGGGGAATLPPPRSIVVAGLRALTLVSLNLIDKSDNT
eukprot:CAMPEP_0182854232 /NCGR_PEP_ID=MMETSP0034_2-20130328/1122_1 /TAXON_ID=156128 /ORGANISM="Nephroselmis pyriformis, Strain CCMP717" /LENGTH=225 /DNA_ID=CAMNT_0024985039 /DNA_START=1264 /DNA_END=1942 /DNA_ORIENTATION=-